MTWGVLPVMGRKFQAFRHTDDPTLTCRTCHGASAEARGYAMPNPELAPLAADRLPRADASPVARFMHDEVVPTMRELTEDPSLSCFSCHPHEREGKEK